MALHLTEQVLAAVKTTLTGLATTGANVYRERAYSHETTKLPSLNILQGEDVLMDDEDDGAILARIDHRLFVIVEIRVRETVAVDTTVNLIRKEMTIAMLADHTLGVTGIINTVELSTSAVQVETESGKPVARADVTWRILYRRQRSDPSLT